MRSTGNNGGAIDNRTKKYAELPCADFAMDYGNVPVSEFSMFV